MSRGAALNLRGGAQGGSTCSPPLLHGRYLIVYGGYETPPGGGASPGAPQASDLHFLDLPTVTWQSIAPSGHAPRARAHHFAAPLGDSVLLFGGTSLGTTAASYDVCSLRLQLHRPPPFAGASTSTAECLGPGDVGLLLRGGDERREEAEEDEGYAQQRARLRDERDQALEAIGQERRMLERERKISQKFLQQLDCRMKQLQVCVVP